MELEALNNSFNMQEIREKFGLTQAEMAGLLFINIRTYRGYENGETMIPRPMFELLKYKVFELHFCLTELNYRKYADTFKV